MTLRDFFTSFFSSRKQAKLDEATLRAFRLQYSHFKDLLRSNAELGTIMAEIDETLHSANIFGMNEIRALATRSVFHAMRMVIALNAISGSRYVILNEMVEHINARIITILDSKPPSLNKALTISLTDVTRDHTDIVGGKCANLGELRNNAHIPIPDGFAITTAAYETFLNTGDLREEILKLLRKARPDNPQSVVEVSNDIFRAIANVTVPKVIAQELYTRWDRTFDTPLTVRTALRSSAISEDGILSFSGQYKTVLGVTRDTLEKSFLEVLASLFSPRAITYRIHHGVSFEQCAMGMACIEMVDAHSSGVIFSRHPVNPLSDEMVLNAIWGLGAYAVDGIIKPDTWTISTDQKLRITSRSISTKEIRLVADTHGKREEAVPETMRDMPSLTDTQVLELANLAARLEQHYHHPQDVEWAVDKQGQIMILQSRPMKLASVLHEGASSTPINDALLLLQGGDIACSGVGAGDVVHIDSLPDLSAFPEGGILIAKHSLPNYALVMNRARAIVTEAGSITGHMASLAREFRVPTILNLKGALQALPADTRITVDAITGRIYAGEVPELLSLNNQRRFTIADSPVHATLRQVAEQIVPLHLLDPKSPLFRPESCTTLHDIMRFVHERCYTEMFRISDRASDAGSVSRTLKAKLPIDLHIIDLGGGLDGANGPYVYYDQIISTPLNALLAGMLLPAVHIKGPRPINMTGFLSVMNQHLLEPPTAQAQRFGERSYCIISDKYLNFSSRVGYHYCVIDAYCGQTVSKNYITFQFKGGAADEIRRERRVRCIALILECLGFSTEVRSDMTQAKFQKFDQHDTNQCLDQLGRLLIVTRQMDMLMVNDQAVTTLADNFLAGRYH